MCRRLPDGKDYDKKKAILKPALKLDENIKKVLLPESDPIYGLDSPVISNWKIR